MIARRSLFASGCLLSLLLSTSAHADWPSSRHDPQRTGAATGTSDLVKPVPYWRAFLGGTLDPLGMIPVDLDGDMKAELVFSSNGRIVAKRADDSVLWQTALSNVNRLVAADDLDGDGVVDIVAATRDRVLVFSGKTGALEWAEPEGEMGTLGAVRVADLDGDKKADIVVQECACCAIASGKTGFAYRFAKGFSAPEQFWTLPQAVCGGERSLAVLDANGDGKLEVANGTNQGLTLVNGATGATIATTPDLGALVGASNCLPVNVDGAPGDELMCIANASFIKPSGHRAFLVKFDTVASPATAKVVWSKDLGDTDGFVYWGNEVVADLDGDGKKELMLGAPTAGKYTTYILDVLTGDELGQIVGVWPEGIASSGAKPTALVSDGKTLSGHKFTRGATPALATEWKIDDRRVTSVQDWAVARFNSFGTRTLELDVNGDKSPELFVRNTSEIRAYTLGAAPASAGAYVVPAGTTFSGVWLTPGVTAPGAQVALARNDGSLAVLDAALKPVGVGVRFGGYLASGGFRSFATTPVVGKLGSGKGESILVPDSRGYLLRLDPEGATLSVGPTPKWSRPNTTAPAIVAGLNGTAPGIVCRTASGAGAVAALTADGKELWTHPYDGVAFNDIVPAKIDGDAVPDLVLQWGNSGDLFVQTRAINGATGKAIWNAAPVNPGAGRQPSAYSIGDWNKDGTDDVVWQGLATRVLSGKDGVEIASGGLGAGYLLPILSDVDGDGALEITLHGGPGAAGTLKQDLKTFVWQDKVDDKPLPSGAVATCASGGPVFISTSVLNTARIKLTKMSGASAGMSTSLVLAGGASYPDEAAAKAKAFLGQLSSVNVHSNLDGKARPLALVGSTDGFMYAVDPCASSLVFAHDFGSAVGSPIFGDTDGDGKDEIIVSVGDGYIYGLRQERVGGPTDVRDLEPGSAGTTDVDVTSSRTQLVVAWGKVTGATAYEVAAIGSDGKYLGTWKNVGDVDTATIDATLTPGAHYAVAVRALTPAGEPGPDVASDGVTVTPDGTDAGPGSDAGPGDDAGGDAGAGGDGGSSSCSCQTPAGGGGVGAFFALLGAIQLLAVRRRSRRE